MMRERYMLREWHDGWWVWDRTRKGPADGYGQGMPVKEAESAVEKLNAERKPSA